MELLVATWTLRLAIVAIAAVGAISWSVGTPLLECVDRAIAAAFVFTLAGRWLIGALEPQEARIRRMRAQREASRSKAAGKGAKGDARAGKGKTAGAGGSAGKKVATSRSKQAAGIPAGADSTAA
jgi:hypothetical protein